MDKLDCMRVFVEVAKHKSFVLASESLDLSAPAATRAVASLEARLKVKLLHRTTRHVRLTQSGAQYLEDAKRILEDIEDAESNVAGIFGKPSGTLSITAPVLFGQMHVIPVIASYLDAYPDVNVAAHFLDKVSSLLEEELEVAIRIGHLKDSNLYATQVGKVRRIVVASPEYLNQYGEPGCPSDLAEHSIVCANTFHKQNAWEFYVDGKHQQVHFTPRLVSNQNGAALRAAIMGQGLTQLMSYQVGEELKKGTLRSVLSGFEKTPLPVNVVHLEGRRANAKVRAFIELATEKLRQNPYINPR